MNRFRVFVGGLMTLELLVGLAIANDDPPHSADQHGMTVVDESTSGQVPVKLVRHGSRYRSHQHGYQRPSYRNYRRPHHRYDRPSGFDHRPYDRYYYPQNLYRPYAHAPYYGKFYSF